MLPVPSHPPSTSEYVTIGVPIISSGESAQKIEFVIIDEISYRFNEKQRGEVIIFKNPEDTKDYFIKRVIGLPGETISMKDGRVFIGDEILEEPYIEKFSSDPHEAIILGEDEYGTACPSYAKCIYEPTENYKR